VDYLGYPGNYGMVPRTLLPKELGGDGDPLDVLVLGPAVPRGAVVRARVIGVLELFDGGEQDDKLLAVLEDTPFADIRDLRELDARFPGVSEIARIWFTNYKGPGVMESRGFGSAERALEILTAAMAAYEASR
jgi:inorganic pyrophosphatase